MFLPKTPFSKSNYFGIAINAFSVRAMSVDNNGKVLSKAAVYFSNPLIVKDILDRDQLFRSLKQLQSEGSFSQKYAAVAIPEKFAFSRAHTLPHLDDDEITEALVWQIEKIFPFSKQDVYLDWKLISEDKETSKVMVTVIPKNILDQLKSSLQSVGVLPISFEPSTTALSRLIPPEHSQKLIIVEIDLLSTTASLVIGGVAILTITTNFTPNSPTQELINQIFSSIQHISRHMQSLNLDAEGIQLLLTGEKANTDISSYLQEQLKVSTSIMEVPGINPEDHLVYIAASANILPPESKKSINLLPSSLQTYYLADMNYQLAKSVAAYVITLCIISLTIISLVTGFVYWSKFQADTKLNDLKAQTQLVGSSNLKLGEINKKSQRIAKLFSKKVSPEQYLVSLYNLIPEGITLMEVNLTNSGQAFEIKGTARDRQTLVALKDAIAKSQLFTTPKIPLSAYQDSANTPFVLSFKVKPTE